MKVNLKDIQKEIEGEFQIDLIKNMREADKKDQSSVRFLSWISSLKGLSKAETYVNGSYIKLSSNASNLFLFGYDHVISEPFLGVFHELYSTIILDLPIKYVAIKSDGILLALFERENRVILKIKSVKGMMRHFYNAHQNRTTMILRPHDYVGTVPCKLKEIKIVKDKETFNKEFVI